MHSNARQKFDQLSNRNKWRFQFETEHTWLCHGHHPPCNYGVKSFYHAPSSNRCTDSYAEWLKQHVSAKGRSFWGSQWWVMSSGENMPEKLPQKGRDWIVWNQGWHENISNIYQRHNSIFSILVFSSENNIIIFLIFSKYQPLLLLLTYFYNLRISNKLPKSLNYQTVQNLLPKILTLWVGRNNVTDDRHRRTAHAIKRT